MGRARSITLGAYLLHSGRILQALESASRRGARVVVRAEARPFGQAGGPVARANARNVDALARLGADARLVDCNESDEAPMHMKAAVCDGVAYLDDRNWPDSGADTLLRDTTRTDIAAIRAALDGRVATPSNTFWTQKADALRGETAVLRGAKRAACVDVESEYLGRGSGVYGALDALARAGVRCRLLVSKRDVAPREADALKRLAADGVGVRAGNLQEKFAIAGARAAWIGSANATTPYYDGAQLDWGIRTARKDVVSALQQRFDAAWIAARPWSA
jgi:hypothetical protein